MLLEYIKQSYITLILLVGMIVIMISTRRIKIKGTEYAWVIMALVFVLTICEYLDEWCVTYMKPLWILYLTSSLKYWIYPLLILLELFFVIPIKHKLLVLLPYLLDAFLVLLNLFGTGLICSYNSKCQFISGEFHYIPAVIIIFYMLLFGLYSLTFLQRKEYTKSTIVIFMTISTSITAFLEFEGIIVGHTLEIAAIDILIYYFYLAAIHYSEVQKKLYDKELEYEKQKSELLMAQIQPHFINNSLLAIQARCVDYPEIYESIKNFSLYLRSNFDNIGSLHQITFAQELKNIKAYLALEKMNYSDRLSVQYDIESDDFLIPALTVEPLVENAVRHAVAARENGGVVQIIQRDEEFGITIEVRDIGYGKLNLTEKQEKRRGIGVNNVRARLALDNKGELELIPEDNGTCARITLKKVTYAFEERNQTK